MFIIFTINIGECLSTFSQFSSINTLTLLSDIQIQSLALTLCQFAGNSNVDISIVCIGIIGFLAVKNDEVCIFTMHLCIFVLFYLLFLFSFPFFLYPSSTFFQVYFFFVFFSLYFFYSIFLLFVLFFTPHYPPYFLLLFSLFSFIYILFIHPLYVQAVTAGLKAFLKPKINGLLSNSLLRILDNSTKDHTSNNTNNNENEDDDISDRLQLLGSCFSSYIDLHSSDDTEILSNFIKLNSISRLNTTFKTFEKNVNYLLYNKKKYFVSSDSKSDKNNKNNNKNDRNDNNDNKNNEKNENSNRNEDLEQMLNDFEELILNMKSFIEYKLNYCK